MERAHVLMTLELEIIGGFRVHCRKSLSPSCHYFCLCQFELEFWHL